MRRSDRKRRLRAAREWEARITRSWRARAWLWFWINQASDGNRPRL